MTNKQKKRRQRQRRRQNRYNAIIRLTTVLLVLLVGAAVLLLTAPRRQRTVIVNRPQATQTPPAPVITLSPAEDSPTASPVPTASPTPAPTAAPAQSASADLPVYKKAETEDKVIAITVDDCYQVQNLQAIVRVANAQGAKLTIFPVGQNLSKPGMKDTLQGCWKMGYEIENHTWSHSRIFRLPEAEMAAEIWKQSQALNQLLGFNYQEHFFRLMGGDGENDQRTHNYLSQLGFKGIAGWSVSGSDSSLESCKKHLAPGQIYLFHTTDGDTAKLRQFIPYAVSMGYRLVTLNQLLGYPDNAASEYVESAMPQPRAYTVDWRTHRVGDYAWIIVGMQDKLRAMGLLQMDGPSTGYYGEQTAQAVKAFQAKAGLEVTGVADARTQQRLLEI